MFSNRFLYNYHCVSRDISNFSYLRHKAFDGFIISMHQSGTHWLKYMLSLAITHDQGLPLPKYIGESVVFGEAKKPPEYNISTSIAFSHSIPNALLNHALNRENNPYPKYLILIRDMRNTLISHYRKWSHIYNCSFEEYIMGDPLNKNFDKDIWWDIRFLNRWGEIIAQNPEQVQIIKYEDLQLNTKENLNKIIDYFQIEFKDKSIAIEFALKEATKSKMEKKELNNDGWKVVRKEDRDWSKWYPSSLRVQFSNICKEYLTHEFSYGYKDWYEMEVNND